MTERQREATDGAKGSFQKSEGRAREELGRGKNHPPSPHPSTRNRRTRILPQSRNPGPRFRKKSTVQAYFLPGAQISVCAQERSA
jgi:hypothetical protein